MAKHPLLFLVGFALGFLPMLLLLARSNKEPALLAYEPVEELVAVEPSRIESPTVMVLAASDMLRTPVPTPTPTVEPTPLPTLPPSPTPTPDVWSPPEYEPLFSTYSGMYSIDKNVLERLANCESHFNPNAISPDGKYVGMFQFSASTWTAYRMRLGQDANLDLRKNVEESIKTAAFVIQQRGVSPWPSCLR